MTKHISILGSTGSIGTQTLELVKRYNDRLSVSAMSCGSNIDLFEKQIREFKPKLVAVMDEDRAAELKLRIQDLSVDVRAGMDGLLSVAGFADSDITVTAVVGMIGILPTIEAIQNGKDIALANKETLVCAGHIIMPMAADKGVNIYPVDSEHSAIFQCLQGESANPVDKILLTASGGPFLGKKTKDLENVTVSDALNHPNWSMGKKITIDSATMVNKGLEIIEASHLFGVECDRIQVVIQPDSIIHSMVQFADGAVKAQLGTPDMKLPIAYALFYPERVDIPGDRLDFSAMEAINIRKPDEETFGGLSLARRAFKTGGNMPTIFNAANECAVDMFLREQIRFLQIYDIIENAMDNVVFHEKADIHEILETEKHTVEYIKSRY
ncbi:MAG: 1-deoxy-D-xylulose-5-phosphate reductoisomerase [Lachnospiraceae bacterium]|nr:1-deoxy-D-xylulose-5-phosphate reductoisomerase [Lachnospiraceae bacterium]